MLPGYSDKNFILLDKPGGVYRTWGTSQKSWCCRFLSFNSERLSWEALGRLRLGVGHPTLGLWTPSETIALRLEVETQSKALLAQDGEEVWVLLRNGLSGNSETRLFSFRYLLFKESEEGEVGVQDRQGRWEVRGQCNIYSA